MKALALALLAALPAVAFGQDVGDVKVSPELEKLQGKWKVVRHVFSGMERKEASNEETIRGDKWLRPKKRTTEYRLDLNPSKEPKQVDLTAGRLGDVPLKGIYKLEGDKLTICYAYNPEAPRPSEFKSEPGDMRYVYELERVKKK